MRVSVFDTGTGNLHSLLRALDTEDVDVRVEDDARAAIDADVLVLPGVGAFGAAAARLAAGRDSVRAALRDGLPCLGICLGMQLLFERSEEGEGHGLGVIAGAVTRLVARRVPHIGWNTLDADGDPLFARAPLPIAYFANGYACRPDDQGVVRAWTAHEGDRFPAAVRVGRTLGVQFHPEKSARDGVAWVRAFLDEARS